MLETRYPFVLGVPQDETERILEERIARLGVRVERNTELVSLAQHERGVAARGGSIDGPGAVVVGGTLYVSSGYSFFGTLPGNALLAYSVDGR